MHDEYKIIYGYFDVNGIESIDEDYLADDPMYKTHSLLLKKFVSIICNFVYKKADDNGAINANTIVEALGMNVCNSINEQVIEISNIIIPYFDECLSRKHILSHANIEKALIEIVKNFIIFKLTTKMRLMRLIQFL